ncbi:hypothetical protein JCM5350_006264 [Sporobolomyces pararoseus]
MTSTSTTSNRPEPSGPICAFGSRLGYTYFPSPAPHPDQLNKSTTTTTTTTGGEGGVGDYWFTIDDQLVYLSFYQDYGPLNIGCVYRFCLHLHNLLEDPTHRHQRIFLYSSDEPDKKVNAALLMSLYAMVVMRWSVADVLHPISSLELQPYRDAGYSRSDYHLHPQQILYGLSRALSHQLLDLSTFDLAAYEKAEKVEEGDWNWITPGFIAFASPVEAGWNTTTESSSTGTGGGGRLTRSFRNVLEEFENKNVRVVVRLNKKLYDRNHFLERGIDHVEMYFDDGTNPTMEMCREFIDLSDRVISTGGAVAVHCKAGLGRTGTLIGAYLIYKHGFTADEAIGFMRLMRPGSCVGPQQHFLYENQLEWVRWSAQDELRAELSLSLQNSQPQPSTSSTSTSTHNVRDCSAPPRPITPPNESELREAARQRSSTPHVAPTTHTSNSNINAPVTPRRQTNVVPGQPRKTPGKSRHGISAPEEKDKDSPNAIVTIEKDKEKEEGGDEEMEEALREEEEMEGVVLNSSPNKKKRDSGIGGGRRSSSGRKSLQLVPDDESKDDEEEEEEEEEDPLTMLPSSPKKPLQNSQQGIQPPSTANKPNQPTTTSTSTRPKTPSAATGTSSSSSSNRPTRIARSSAVTTPNATTTVDQSSNVIARSRGAKNLNTVFESVESGGGGGGNKAGGPSTRSRYPLRNVSGRTTPTITNHSSSSTTTSSGVPGVVAPNSPSKLPTRIPAKRGVPNSPSISTSTQSQSHQRGGFDPSTATGGKKGTESSSNKGFTSLANGLAKLGGGGKAGGRNVRRRRSSMGSQDFVQAG